MKKAAILIMAVLLFGCAGKETKPTPAPFIPQGFDASQYNAKVDNFVVIFDASSSMDGKYEGAKKFDTASNVVDRLNQTLPELGYKAWLRSFGPDDGTGRETDLIYGPAVYSTSGFGQAIEAMPGPAGNTPLGRAISYAGADLAESGDAGDKTAVIIVSDGKEPTDDPAAYARKLKEDSPNSCFYTVQIGDDQAGGALLSQIAEIGECGFSKSADEVYSSAAMAAFVKEIFLSEKPAPPPRKVVAPPPKPCPDEDRDGVCDDMDRCPGTPQGVQADMYGCWVLGEVLFDFDKAVIKPNAYPLLDEVVRILSMNPDLNVVFEGHTDSVGTEAYNQGLSERRAKAVMQYVMKKGIPADQVSAVGYGESRPAATNKTKEGRALNRRVEITPKQ